MNDVAALWVQLAVTAAIILVASNFLAKSADVIAVKTGLGRSFIGVVLLATATSLPELGTGLSSVALVGEPDLAAGDAFGSNLFNLLIIGILDLFWRNGPILNSVSPTAVLVAALGIAFIALASIATLVHGATVSGSGWPLSPASVLMILLFVGAMFMIFQHERAQTRNNGPASEAEAYEGANLGRAVVTYVVAAVVVVVTAVFLATIGDGLAEEMGWEKGFVGTLFLAFSTSLPELATSFAAIRLRAPELAISNVLGSNLFNMGFVLFLDDVAYVQGVFWANISPVHVLTGAMAIFMTCVVIVALLSRPRKRPFKYWTVEGAALAFLYVVAAVLVFNLAPKFAG